MEPAVLDEDAAALGAGDDGASDVEAGHVGLKGFWIVPRRDSAALARAVIALAGDAAERERLGQAARETGRRYDINAFVRKMEQLIAAALIADELSLEDRQVAVEARKQRLEAQTEIITENADARRSAATEDATEDIQADRRDDARRSTQDAAREFAREMAEKGYAETQNLQRRELATVGLQIDIAA